MGSVVFEIGLAAAPADPAVLDGLHREAWKIVAERMGGLATRGPSDEILRYYLNFQESDGRADGGWFAERTALCYALGDAAGLCVVEMYACLHWARLAAASAWPRLTGLAERHGARLEAADSGEVATLLTAPASHVFFYGADGLLGMVAAPDGTEAIFYDGGVVPLDALGDDRERVTGLVRAGRCACDPCQALREEHDLPPTPEQTG